MKNGLIPFSDEDPKDRERKQRPPRGDRTWLSSAEKAHFTRICAAVDTDVTFEDVTPFFALLGPPNDLMPLEAESMSKFYKELFRTGDIDASLAKLSHRLELYLAERLLLNAFAGYIYDNRSNKARAPRVDRLLTDVLRHPSTSDVEIGAIRSIIKEHVQPTEEVYERWKARFLMADHPSN